MLLAEVLQTRYRNHTKEAAFALGQYGRVYYNALHQPILTQRWDVDALFKNLFRLLCSTDSGIIVAVEKADRCGIKKSESIAFVAGQAAQATQ